jgi:hypothetical protein
MTDKHAPVTTEDLGRKIIEIIKKAQEKSKKISMLGEPGDSGLVAAPFDNPMEDPWDLIRGGESGAMARFPMTGTDGQVITAQGDGSLAYKDPSSGAIVSVDDTSSVALSLIAGVLTANVLDEYVEDTMSTVLDDSSDIAWTHTDGSDSITAKLTDAAKTFTINMIINGGGSVLVPGDNMEIVTDKAGTIVGCVVLSKISGSFTGTIKKSSYSGYPGSLTSIVASAKPTLSSAQKSTDSTLTGWTTSFSAGDIFEASTDTATTVQRVTIALKCVAT